MSDHPVPCPYCGRPQVWMRCEYPFLYHKDATPRHGEWVPDHGCVADASRASDEDRPMDCEAGR